MIRNIVLLLAMVLLPIVLGASINQEEAADPRFLHYIVDGIVWLWDAATETWYAATNVVLSTLFWLFG